ncbi:hypothetical protein [Mycobacterium sp. SP-6446]|uniref:hypothetical protein n=1 Tax=Mycobacterium sp. SP-6446 TaxID=1834162 RepID=UPI00111587B5|nr:hypothetical protein [Mycobacterium sp. SP-6446]
MLQAGGGQIANWGCQQHDSKGLYEPVNLILVDRISTSAQLAINKLNKALTNAGFPSRLGHTVGFSGRVGNTVYKQQPDILFAAYADAPFVPDPDNHGRVFGPAPAANGQGFVWSAAFSRERPSFYDGQATHVYESFNIARDRLHTNLVATGAADLGPVRLDNAINAPTVTTGDHDGYAAAVELT